MVSSMMIYWDMRCIIGLPRSGVNEVWTGQVKVHRMNSAGSSWERLGQSIYGDNAVTLRIRPDCIPIRINQS
jgi:hypothetical protein